MVVLEYRCPGGEYLYEFMVEHIKRYYLKVNKQMSKEILESADFDIKMVG